MQLHLARWEDPRGSSAGSWLVREISGLGLVRGVAGWRARLVLAQSEICHQDLLRRSPLPPMTVLLLRGLGDVRAAALWGSGYSATDALALLAKPHLQRDFATRTELLDALSATGAPATGALADALDIPAVSAGRSSR